MRLGRGSSFLFWKLHSVSLGEGTVDLHKCLALGLRNYHEDVDSGEEAEGSEDEETVGPDGRLEHRGARGRETLQTTRLVPLRVTGMLLVVTFILLLEGKTAGSLGPSLSSKRDLQCGAPMDFTGSGSFLHWKPRSG